MHYSHRVVYLTGWYAAGKSTAIELVDARLRNPTISFMSVGQMLGSPTNISKVQGKQRRMPSTAILRNQLLRYYEDVSEIIHVKIRRYVEFKKPRYLVVECSPRLTYELSGRSTVFLLDTELSECERRLAVRESINRTMAKRLLSAQQSTLLTFPNHWRRLSSISEIVNEMCSALGEKWRF